jgi:hypothetical protein
LYDLALVEPGPLPPHERSWRHPSELGPTRHDLVDESGGHLAPFVFGALAVVAVAGLVITMTPRAVSNPVALSATTMPPAVVSVVSAPDAGTERSPSVPTAQPSGIPMGALLTSFAAFPHAVTSGPRLDLDGTGIAPGEPDATDVVLVRTDAVTYRLPWGQVPLLDMPDGTVVFTVEGDLLAHVRRGDLVVLNAD